MPVYAASRRINVDTANKFAVCDSFHFFAKDLVDLLVAFEN